MYLNVAIHTEMMKGQFGMDSGFTILKHFFKISKTDSKRDECKARKSRWGLVNERSFCHFLRI